ncbi:caldesmon-like [Chenopodium quinoa]|uniref:caldesmon-like n=1 Tax=Chenopodium quinoa TaxID=63459 RepID=UPI000B76C60A|nr:caldesmon-like [Chenopodium quinoa]
MEVDQRTTDPKEGVQEEVQESAVKHSAEASEKPAAEGFLADIAREFVHNQALTLELINSLQDKLEAAEEDKKIAEEEAKLARLRQLAAEENQQNAEKYEKKAAEAIQTFCQAMEKEIFPPLLEGEIFLREHGVVDIPNFKAAIERRIRDGAAERIEEVQQRLEALEANIMAAEEALRARDAHLSEVIAAAEAQNLKLQELENQLKAKEDDLSKDSSSKLTDELKKSKKGLEESQKKLADVEALLKVRIYTQEEYELGYKNGFRVCRRVCLHAEPNLDWSKCAAWVQDPEDPHMKYPTPVEAKILEAEEAEEESERREIEAEQREKEAQLSAKPASFAVGAETTEGPSAADQLDSLAEA